MRSGVIGGRVGYRLLRWMTAVRPYRDRCDGRAYRGRSKIETLFGASIWPLVEGRVVLDYGCGTGDQVIEIARHGARKIIGLDISESSLAIARERAARAAVADRCVFTTRTREQVDVILSLDAFEHFFDARRVLWIMRRLLKPGGRVLASFGPPWLHPYGGHVFSVFPWAHLIFTERALLQWRAEFKSDGATRFCEVAGGLNRMTVKRFRRLVEQAGFTPEEFQAVPIRRLKLLAVGPFREFFTSVVRCCLIPWQRSDNNNLQLQT